MRRDTQRSGLILLLAGLACIGFFLLTDPKIGLTGRAAGVEIVDAIAWALPGTWIGTAGGIVIAAIGLWLMTRRMA